MAATRRTNVLFIGNPGVGKSTLLNALIGNAEFKAGESYTGSGVTQILQEAHHDGIIYMDTPGLNDYEKRQQCAAEITAALKKSGLYYICFVITTEEGRLRPDDKATIRLVLDSAPEIGGQYSIIVNKLPPGVYKNWSQDAPDRFPSIFFRDFPTNMITKSIYYMKRDNNLEGEDKVFDPNVLLGFSDWLKKCPAISISPEKVTTIKEEAWEVMVRDYQKTIDQLQETMKKNSEDFQRILAEERQRQEEAQRKAEERQAEVERTHRAEIDRMNQQIIALANRPVGGCCFPSKATCRLENGDIIKVSEVKEGQRVYTVDRMGKITTSEVYYVDGELGPTIMKFIFYKGKDETQKCLIATPEHLIYATSEKQTISKFLQHSDSPITAKSIKVGDFVYVVEDGQVFAREVTVVKEGHAEGRWSVLTQEHRLLVDDVLVSAYEIEQNWGIADTVIMRGLYSVVPGFVTSPENKWFCKQYDQFFEPIVKGVRDWLW